MWRGRCASVCRCPGWNPQRDARGKKPLCYLNPEAARERVTQRDAIMASLMNTATATAGIAPKSFKDVWLISAGHGLTHWYTATFYLLLPLIGNELGLSYTEIGLIMTVQHLAGAIMNLPGGFIVDIVGKKGYLMAASLFWVGFPYALMSLTHKFWMLLVL